MKASEVKHGHAFKYADQDNQKAWRQQEVFIRLWEPGEKTSTKVSVVNVANWCAAHVDHDQEVVDLGDLMGFTSPLRPFGILRDTV